jgi:cytochrome c peroxidase
VPQSYPLAAQRGLKLFVGRGNCSACHSGPNFTDGEFRATVVPPFASQRVPDAGRYAGIKTLRTSRFNLLGRYNDDVAGTSARATREVKLDPSDRGKWRTPSLRNVAVTAPYLHNGGAASLHDVVRRYAKSGGKRPRGDDEHDVRRADLSGRDIDDLVAFLDTLTDADGARRPLAPPEASPCD